MRDGIAHSVRRRSIRLRGYDYAQSGAYFVTICAYHMACLFGEVVNGEVQLNEWGQIVDEEWRRTSEVRAYVSLDAFVIMPNHMHGIIVLDRRGDPPGRPYSQLPARGPAAGSLGAVVGQFKSQVTKRIRASCGRRDVFIWQRNYYEHIIRNEADLARIRRYIAHNPARWMDDSDYSGG